MKKIFVSFQGINKYPEGMVRILYPIFEKFKDNNSVYFMSYCETKDKNLKRLFFYNKLKNLVTKILNKLNYNIGKIRYIQEILFDIFMYFKITEPSFIVTTALIPLTSKKNKMKGGINIFIAGNPYDRAICDDLLKEMQKHNITFQDAYTYNKRLNFIDNFLNFQDYIITQTSVTYTSYTNYGFKNIKNLEYHPIPNFANKEISQKKIDDKVTFLYLAHSVWLKGLYYLLEAWGMNNFDAKLIIGGYIHPLVAEKIVKFNNNVTFVPYIKYDNLNEFFSKGDVTIVPSLFDDHPATIIESLYFGLPVITTDKCGSSSLIKDGYNGFVIPPKNSDEIANKILWFIENKNNLQIMKENAKNSIKVYNVEKQINDYFEYINNIYQSNLGIK